MLNDVTKVNRAKDLERQMPRMSKWQVGDVYAPHDLSAVEAAKWRKRKSSARDVFDILGINPLEEYKVCFDRYIFVLRKIFCFFGVHILGGEKELEWGGRECS